MESATDVEEEITSEDSSPEETTDLEESSLDTSSEATLKPDKSSRDKANERIRDLIEQRNALAAQVSVLQNQGKREESAVLDGVTDEGIDPQKYAASLLKRAQDQTAQLTNSQVAFQLSILEVQRDPVMKSKVAQEHVSSLINHGFKPTEALEIYKDDLKTIEAEILERTKARKEATAATREGTTITASGKSSTAPSGTFTWQQVESMPIAEYKKNQAEIKRQAAAGLIK